MRSPVSSTPSWSLPADRAPRPERHLSYAARLLSQGLVASWKGGRFIMSCTKDVTDVTFPSEVPRSGRTVLVDFWAAWCRPCRAVSPVVEQIAAEYSDKITVV